MKRLQRIRLHVRVPSLPVVAMTDVEMALRLAHAERDEIVGLKLKQRVQVKGLDVVHLEELAATAGGARGM